MIEKMVLLPRFDVHKIRICPKHGHYSGSFFCPKCIEIEDKKNIKTLRKAIKEGKLSKDFLRLVGEKEANKAKDI